MCLFHNDLKPSLISVRFHSNFVHDRKMYRFIDIRSYLQYQGFLAQIAKIRVWAMTP